MSATIVEIAHLFKSVEFKSWMHFTMNKTIYSTLQKLLASATQHISNQMLIDSFYLTQHSNVNIQQICKTLFYRLFILGSHERLYTIYQAPSTQLQQ